MTHNQANYQGRLDFVRSLIRNRLKVEADAQVTPIQYDPECPFKYNNFIYHITLPSPFTRPDARNNGVLQPGCTAIPEGTEELVVRLTNSDAEGMSPEARVENEVAMIQLARSALESLRPSVVPAVYGWSSALNESRQGWIMQQFMPGKPVDESFSSMNLPQKQNILSQMACILKSLQDYKLPDSVAGYGGLKFDDDGRIVSAPVASVGAGPWTSYASFFQSRFDLALKEADTNPYIQGWRVNGLRERLDTFGQVGIAQQFDSLKIAEEKTIVHADFTANNLLFDPSTQRLTGLIDYDFACILHPSYEFLRSFDGAGGRFQGWSGDEAGEQTALRKAKLHGFPSPLPPSTEDGVDWELAKAWEDELEKVDAKRPATMGGIDKVADVDSLIGTILPWRLSNADILKLQSEEVILRCRDENEAQLVQLLDHLGF
ncbi:phosphotransferase enzyme family-domain-containing protein [Xylariomycetidae sp. FL2044]|nr:phosphotransferase enzyme family-domain-containing protein [Xylariomycetidae sp. FL2044]